MAAVNRQRRIRNGENDDEMDNYRQAYEYYWNNQVLPGGGGGGEAALAIAGAASTANGSISNGRVNTGKQVTLIEVLQSANNSPDSDEELKK